MPQEICILTYNGVDGACAAATVLLKHPEARLEVTSAARVGQSLRELVDASRRPAELHVCGLGVWCDWEEVSGPASELKAEGTRIYWYCGRGYLNSRRDRFESFCTPIFLDLSTNTAAVREHIRSVSSRESTRLAELARHDPHNEADPGHPQPTERERWWMDFIEASISQYFKYQDIDAYRRAIRKLARNEAEERDARMVEVFRRNGMRYVLRGKSDVMKRLRERIRRCAEADEHVLITGESGVGKEYVAHLIHERSSRAMGPMIPVNCAVFAGNVGLANSVLFGHLKGAFTGASTRREGAFVAADSGILFLDELGELPLEVQSKLLRVLEDGWITPEGADRPERKVDVRVVAATNREISRMVQEGTFRADLYHRLDTLRVPVPPLREHPDDIPAIAEHALSSLHGESPGERLSSAQHETLRRYRWPGNVRQLLKVLKRARHLNLTVEAALNEESRSTPPHTGQTREGAFLPRTPEDIRTIEEVKSAYAARALEVNRGNRSDTARKLDISPNTLRSYVDNR
jgi:DNA-binding NtrC family response regulator